MTADPRKGAAAWRQRVCVIGAGYVGLVTAACLAEIGHHVSVIEADRNRFTLLRRGTVPIREAGLDEIVSRQVETGRLTFHNRSDELLQTADLVMIAVGTPSTIGGRADLSAVEDATRAVTRIAPRALIVIKSTVPPGTAGHLEAMAHAEGHEGVRVVSNPEFLREGHAIADFMRPDRIVIGSADREAGATVAALYLPLRAEVVHCRPGEAELSKYASNALLAARISFMNEMSWIADRVGADVTRVAHIVGLDGRIGPAFLSAGLGWGGSCFPKDVNALAAFAEDLGEDAPMLRATIDVNRRQRQRALSLTLGALELAPERPVVTVLGVAFKPGTDDVRESPALWLVTRLLEANVEVRVTDPLAMEQARRVEPGALYLRDPHQAIRGADAVVLATEWPEWQSLDWNLAARAMRGNTIIDARNVLSAGAVMAAGLRYRALGRDGLGAPATGARVRILIASDSFEPKVDGVSDTSAILVRALRLKGHEVVVVAPGPGPMTLDDTPVHRLPSVPLPGYPEVRLSYAFGRLRRAITELRPETAIVMTTGPVGIAAMLALPRRVPITHVYTTDMPGYLRAYHAGVLMPGLEALLQWMGRRATVTLCPTEVIRDDLQARGIERLGIWGRGVDTELFRPTWRSEAMRARLTGGEPERPLVLYVGRFAREKRILDLLEATRQLKHARFALVGDGPQRADLERLFPADRTVFTGYLRGAPLAEAFASADVFAFPSDTDTFGQTVLQALASGVPAVVARGTAPAQFVPHGDAGLHVEPRSPMAMAAAIGAIVDDPELRAHLVSGTSAAIAGRTWSALIDRMDSLLSGATA